MKTELAKTQEEIASDQAQKCLSANIDPATGTLQRLLQVGENTVVEYKSCENEVSHSVYESVCAMLNHNGGHILMGVLNDAIYRTTNHQS